MGIESFKASSKLITSWGDMSIRIEVTGEVMPGGNIKAVAKNDTGTVLKSGTFKSLEEARTNMGLLSGEGQEAYYEAHGTDWYLFDALEA